MRINNNIAAMNTHRQYTLNTSAVAKSTEKLSSGFRINRAGDDAAGLAISEKMRAQIRGLKMASKNSQDAISLVQTAEGALQETHNILQRMRELATQSASDTNETSIDRAALNAEFQQLIAEIDDTANKTKFNDMGIIDGSFAQGAKLATVAGATGASAVATIEVGNGSAVTINATFRDDAADGGTGNDSARLSITVGGQTYTADIAHNATSATLTVAGDTEGQYGSITLTFNAAVTEADIDAIYGTDGTDGDGGAAVQAKVGASITIANDPNNQPRDPFIVQTGANMGDELAIHIENMNATSLKVNSSSIATRAGASTAITEVNTAINAVSTQRAKLGALQNRLNHKINNLDTSAENLSAAESRIRDLDMAQEMTTFTRNNIITQASTAMLAQANAAPQGVLSLLQ